MLVSTVAKRVLWMTVISDKNNWSDVCESQAVVDCGECFSH